MNAGRGATTGGDADLKSAEFLAVQQRAVSFIPLTKEWMHWVHVRTCPQHPSVWNEGQKLPFCFQIEATQTLMKLRLGIWNTQLFTWSDSCLRGFLLLSSYSGKDKRTTGNGQPINLTPYQTVLTITTIYFSSSTALRKCFLLQDFYCRCGQYTCN